MKIAQVFKNGQSQAVRLPKEFRFSQKQVYVNKVGNAVILIAEDKAMDSLLQGINAFTDDFMETREQGSFDVREGIFK